MTYYCSVGWIIVVRTTQQLGQQKTDRKGGLVGASFNCQWRSWRPVSEDFSGCGTEKLPLKTQVLFLQFRLHVLHLFFSRTEDPKNLIPCTRPNFWLVRDDPAELTSFFWGENCGSNYYVFMSKTFKQSHIMRRCEGGEGKEERKAETGRYCQTV